MLPRSHPPPILPQPATLSPHPFSETIVTHSTFVTHMHVPTSKHPFCPFLFLRIYFVLLFPPFPHAFIFLNSSAPDPLRLVAYYLSTDTTHLPLNFFNLKRPCIYLSLGPTLFVVGWFLFRLEISIPPVVSEAFVWGSARLYISRKAVKFSRE